MNFIYLNDINVFISEAIADALLPHFPNLVVSKLVIPSRSINEEPNSNEFIVNGRKIILTGGGTLDDYSVIYIGEEGKTLTSFHLVFSRCSFYRYDPVKDNLVDESSTASRCLRKRVACIENARSSKTVGILVGTLNVPGFNLIIDHLHKIGRQAGKKTRTIAPGRLNPAKLANFASYDVFVHVACWEETIVDGKNFNKPIITPFEFEIACNSNRQWMGEYVTDFQQLLPGGRNYVEMSEVDAGLSQNCNGSVIPKEGTIMEAGEFLNNRSWNGLEPQIGQTEPADVIPGDCGIASIYSRELIK
ncbi:Diphthamide biosynthesis protein 2, variant 2 [Chamberlinius hualienensis]